MSTRLNFLETNKVTHHEIPFYRPSISINELKSVLEAIVRDEITFGKIVLFFEKECAKVLNFPYGVSLSSLTSAYHLVFLSLNIQEGDEIIVPSTSSVSILDAISYIKAKPVVVDIDRNSFHPSKQDIENKITPKTKLVLLNYVYGSFYNYLPLVNQLKKDNIYVVEDISEIIGKEFEHDFIGSNADLAIASFHENMPLTMGKGAVILTGNHDFYHILKDIRVQGGTKPYRIRYDYTITDYQAAMGIEQLDKLSMQLESRQKIGKIYLESLISSAGLMTYFNSPQNDNYFNFPILTGGDLNALKRYFGSLKISVQKSLQHQPIHRLLNLDSKKFPNIEKLYEKSLIVPMYASLHKQQVERISIALKKYY